MTYSRRMITKTAFTPTGPSASGSAPGIWRMDEVAYWKKQGLWPDSSILPDTYFKYVSLLLSTTSLSNSNNNLFVDSSGAFNPINRIGNTTQGSFSPYGSNWSNYFDGASDYLSVADNAALQMGTGDFTIEYWWHPTSVAGYQTPFEKGYTSSGGLLMQTGNGDGIIYVYASGSVAITANTAVSAGVWTHVALVRSGTSLTLYLNGTSVGTNTNSTNFNNAGVVGIASNVSGGGAGAYPIKGHMSNVRMVKGTAVYTSNFTPPISPLTAISGTSLLTCQSNRFRDASTNNLTVTAAGDVRVTDFGPFAPTPPGMTGYNQSDITNWSGYFDGSGDYLSVASNAAFDLGSSDFTVECWFNANSFAAGFGLISRYNYSGVGLGWLVTIQNSTTVRFVRGNDIILDCTVSAMSTGAWYHVAAVRSGSTLTVYLNGTQVGQTTGISNFSDATTALQIGRTNTITNDINGYISNARVVKGTAVYTGNFTPPTTNLTAISGTSLLTLQNAAFTDNSTNNFVITPNGNVTVTGNSPFNPTGYWSLSGTTAQGATIPQTTATDLGSGSFTIECWVNVQTFGSFVTKRRTDTALTGSWMLSADANGYFYFLGVGWASTYAATTNPIPLNKWTHIAVSRSGTNLSMFVDGVRVYNVTDSYDYTCSTYTIIKLGGNEGGNYPSGNALKYGFAGSISNLRIVQGTAVYNPASTSFTVPTAQLTAISGTSLLTCQNATMKDNSTNNNTSIALYNGAALQTFNPFYTSTIASNGGSMYFDGATDYLNAGSSPYFALGSASFTVECWFYQMVEGSTNQMLISTDTAGGFYLGWDSGSFNFGTRAVANIIGFVPTNYMRQWNHVAVSRSGGTISMFYNGTRVATGSNSTDFSITGPMIIGGLPASSAYYWNGYIANARVVKGSAVYNPSSTSITVPTAPLAPTPDTTLLVNGMNASIYDQSTISDIETIGSAVVSSAQSKFGGTSVYVPSSGGCLLILNSPSLAFGTANWTVEFWTYTDASGSKVYFDAINAANNTLYMEIYSSGTNIYWVKPGGAVAITGNGALTANTWQHIAACKNGSSTRLFVNGTQVGSTYTDNDTYDTARWEIGGRSNLAFPIVGYIDEFRITSGIARYTANFTPPDKAFPAY